MKVIIPAFPRSGTSFLTGLIVRMGYSPGPEKWIKKPDEHNPFGYYECLPLMKISRGILKKLGGDITRNIPDLPKNWQNNFHEEKKQILEFVNKGKIEVYKDAPLLLLANMYDELFPQSKWIAIHRDIHETYRSRFGFKMTFEKWEEVTRTRYNKWKHTRAYDKSLNLNYKEFFEDLENTISKISSFLGITLKSSQKRACFDFFRPNQRNRMTSG